MRLILNVDQRAFEEIRRRGFTLPPSLRGKVSLERAAGGNGKYIFEAVLPADLEEQFSSWISSQNTEVVGNLSSGADSSEPNPADPLVS